jgi:hypothetical protein
MNSFTDAQMVVAAHQALNAVAAAVAKTLSAEQKQTFLADLQSSADAAAKHNNTALTALLTSIHQRCT